MWSHARKAKATTTQKAAVEARMAVHTMIRVIG
jgi:hypothetical protein